MARSSAIAFFCEDIRQEKSGQETLVGTMPDNLAVSQFPAMIPKIAVYVRIHLDPEAAACPIKLRLDMPGGEIIELGEISQDIVEDAQQGARKNNHPYIGLISRAVFSPLTVQCAGQISATVSIGDEEHICSALNVSRAGEEDSGSSVAAHG